MTIGQKHWNWTETSLSWLELVKTDLFQPNVWFWAKYKTLSSTLELKQGEYMFLMYYALVVSLVQIFQYMEKHTLLLVSIYAICSLHTTWGMLKY